MQIRRQSLLWLGAAGVLVVAVILVLVLWPGVPPLALGQSLSIGYVDMPKALDGHPRKASSERALQEFFQSKQREFQQRSKGLNAVQRQELDRKLQQQFVGKRDELFGGLDKDIRVAVKKVAEDRGISIVLDRNVVLYGGIDITDDVIAQLKAK